MLIIPTVVMSPTLDEVQQAVNRAVQLVLSVFKAVGQWSKDDGTANASASTAHQRDSSAGQVSVEVERSSSPPPADPLSARDRRASFSSAAPSDVMMMNELGKNSVLEGMRLACNDGSVTV